MEGPLRWRVELQYPEACSIRDRLEWATQHRFVQLATPTTTRAWGLRAWMRRRFPRFAKSVDRAIVSSAVGVWGHWEDYGLLGPCGYDLVLNDHDIDIELDPGEGHGSPLTPLACSRVAGVANVLFVYEKRRSLAPTSMIYVVNEHIREAVLDAFARHGAECVEITGAVDGY